MNVGKANAQHGMWLGVGAALAAGLLALAWGALRPQQPSANDAPNRKLAASPVSQGTLSPVPAAAPAAALEPSSAPEPAPAGVTSSAPEFASTLVRVTPERPSGFVTVGYGRQAPRWDGEPVEAYVTTGGKKIRLDPNQMGAFQRVDVAYNQSAEVVLLYPEAFVGESVIVTVLDGGSINGQRMAVVPVDRSGRAAFRFTASDQQGIYRISLQKRLSNTLLEFWAGPSPVYELPEIATSSTPRKKTP